MGTSRGPELHPESLHKIHAIIKACFFALINRLLLRKHQSSMLHHLQDAIRSPELLHLRQEISGSIKPDPGLEPQEGHRPRGPRLEAPRFPAMKYSGPGPKDYPFSREKENSDKENLPYFRIWKSLTYSNRLRPSLRRLYKGNLNPKARARHFET
ncbi:hypothetical protein F2Q69_00030621 [Brassica cretica]|uniref:Uncharacterized protein n=1 Tax=Brassica cretica TaxID=69181 RepID=A0A8S9S7R5_BRACR|nr:hypothetical protein F2Q69_00030621 [Brassica cretica]